MSPVFLRRQIEQEYDPAQESREDWQSRVLRGFAQLERLGQALTEDEMEKLVWKARYAEDVHGMDLSVQVSSLKKLFGEVLLDEDKYTEGEYNGRLSALMEMLRARGTEMSASVNRMFSSVGTGMPSSLGASPEQVRGQPAGSQQAGGPARVPLAFTPPRKAEVDMLRDEVQTLRAQIDRLARGHGDREHVGQSDQPADRGYCCSPEDQGAKAQCGEDHANVPMAVARG